MFVVEGDKALDSLRTLRNAFQHAVLETTRITLEETERHAKTTKLFSDKTGKTRASIKAIQERMTSGFVEAGGAARYLEEGTRPHEIHAKAGGMLRFEVAGETFFRRMVNHPGTAPRPFMQQARDHGQRIADLLSEALVEEAIRRHP